MYDKIAAWFIFVGFFVLVIPLTSAEVGDKAIEIAQGVIDAVIGYATPVFEGIIGQYSTTEFFFVKCLILIMFFVIIDVVVRSIPKLGENKVVVHVIAISVSIIAVRYISETGIIKGILLPYGSLGIALTIIIPFFVFVYFIHSIGTGGLGRRLLWIIFSIVFLALFVSRYDELPEIGKWIYFAFFVLIIFMFIFDKAIHRYFFLHELSIFYRKAGSKAIAALQAEYMNIIGVNTPEAERRRKEIESDLKRLGGSIP
ncbi:MAG: hypothetical protein N3D20_02475 [Candidatus Pacearchaeota archaeon]|nr:hypothetical protein [Candidatus Pacearchaeota archaeon]